MFIRNLVFTIVILVLIVGVVGFYMGWFHFAADNANHNANFSVNVDKDRIRQDEQKAKEAVENAGHQIKNKTEQIFHRGHDNETSSNPHQTFATDIETRLKAFDAKVGDMQARIARLNAPKKAELSRDMDQLNQKRRELDRKLGELKTAAGKTAEDLKAEINTDIEELHREYDKIAAKSE